MVSEQIAIEWLRDRIDVLSAAGGTLRLETVDHADPLISPVQAGEMLRVALQREGIAPGRTVVVLPREAVVVRRLHLPNCPENELPDLVRFQAATKTSAPIETLVLDYLPVKPAPGSEGQDAITVTYDRERLLRVQSVCAAAGLELERVSLSTLCIGRLVRSAQAPDLGMGGPDLVLYQQGTRLELSIFDEGTLVFCHAVQLPDDIREETLKPLTTELTRSLMALGQSRPDATVARCFYVSGTPHPAIEHLLRQRYGAGLSVVDTAHVGKIDVPPGYEALAGAFLPITDSHLALDLLHPRRKYEAPDRRKFYLALAGAMSVLLASAGGMIFYFQQARLKSDVSLLLKEVVSQQEQLDKGKPRITAYNKVAQWKESDAQPIQLWLELRRHFPSTELVYLTELRFVPSSGEMEVRFVGKGQARKLADIDALNQSLSDQGYRVSPTTPTLGKRDPDFPWQFDLDIEIPRRNVSLPAPKKPLKPTPPKST